MEFSPFSTNIDDLSISDLAVLRSVSEGWHVEYKSELMPAKSIAKSVSAFANTYGGWLFYGVKEGGGGQHMAGSFPGISLAEAGDISMKARDAIASHLSSAPFYRFKILQGPCEALELAEGRSIVAVQIPAGEYPPYIHSDGRIYRRVADKSDPLPETDRSRMDMLWKRGRQSRAHLASFITALPAVAKGESENTYVHLFLLRSLFQQQAIESKMTFDRFREIMNDAAGKAGGIPFDNCYTSANGYVARQTLLNDPYHQTLTWRYRRDCSSSVIIPVNSYELNSPFSESSLFWPEYTQITTFSQICRKMRLSSGRFIDLGYLFASIVYILKKLRTIMAEEEYTRDLFWKVHIQNVWRRVPYLDLDTYTKFISENGIPLIQDSNVLVPAGTEPEDFAFLNFSEIKNEQPSPSGDQVMSVMVPAIIIFGQISAALGLPGSAIGFLTPKHIGHSAFELLTNVLERAQQVSRKKHQVPRK